MAASCNVDPWTSCTFIDVALPRLDQSVGDGPIGGGGNMFINGFCVVTRLSLAYYLVADDDS